MIEHFIQTLERSPNTSIESFMIQNHITGNKAREVLSDVKAAIKKDPYTLKGEKNE